MNPFVLAATGDSLVTQRLSTIEEPEFLGVVEILRNADAAFTNLETTIYDGDAYPAALCDGTWMVAPPCIAEELKWAGLRLLSRANNHALDWAVEGMRETTRLLDAQGLTHAGVGECLATARRHRVHPLAEHRRGRGGLAAGPGGQPRVRPRCTGARRLAGRVAAYA
jgi:poly-gamma-glutamate capsule biosynthesis protein CapA/YwtB (metallophosphatase superfamily)